VIAEPSQRADLRSVVKKQLTQVAAERARRDLRLFMRQAWPVIEPKEFQSSWALDAILDHLAYVTFGDIRNLMICVPPRSTKSLAASVAWPVWTWLLDPTVQFLYASYAHDLALRDAVKSRRLIQSAWFKERYGRLFYLDPRDNQKHRYTNNHGGYRISTSVGGVTTGDGGSIIAVDDPLNAKDAYSDAVRHECLSWWDNSMRSRLNDPKTGQKVLIGQRLHDNDLFGHVLATEEDRWTVLTLPMAFDPARKCVTYFNPQGVKPEGPIWEDPRTERGELLNPDRFGPEEEKAERKAMAPSDYSAQYQQDPSSGGGLILKKGWWRQWVYPQDHAEAGKPMPLPEFIEVISVYDTAYEEDEESDFSARTTWGLFNYSESTRAGDEIVCALLLERFNDRVEFPELKKEAIEHHHEYKPDYTLIERKASGHSLIHELRKAGIPVRAVTPGSRDKVFRAHMVAEILRSGRVWYVPRVWAYEVIDQCSRFPRGEFDDLVDTVVMALAYIRRLNMIELPDDEKRDELKLFYEGRKSVYG
jgi:predicted phage terminase large subunit-like protein